MTQKIEIVDSHNKVLKAWAQCRAQSKYSPQLITLDHHTDTSRPFRNWIKKEFNITLNSDHKELFFKKQKHLLNKIDFLDEASIDEAINKLSNDEHIVAAIESNIISSAFVIAHNAINTDHETFKNHRIVCRTVTNKINTTTPNYDIVLESSFLNHSISEINKIVRLEGLPNLLEEKYILDIDLDYFNTFKSIQPHNDNTFLNLVNNAELITIATEPEYVKGCAIDNNLTSEHLLNELLTLISKK